MNPASVPPWSIGHPAESSSLASQPGSQPDLEQRPADPDAIGGTLVAGLVIIALNLLAAAVLVLVQGFGALRSLEPEVLFDYALFAYACDGSECAGVAEDGAFRMVTSAFMHSDLVHLMSNMFSIWIISQWLLHLGATRYVSLYVVSLFGGAVGVLLLTSPNVPTVGASGAVYGLLGGGVVALMKRRTLYPNNTLIALLAVNLFYTFANSNISIGGHIGGLVTGALFMLLLCWLEDHQITTRASAIAAIAVSVTLILAGTSAASLKRAPDENAQPVMLQRSETETPAEPSDVEASLNQPTVSEILSISDNCEPTKGSTQTADCFKDILASIAVPPPEWTKETFDDVIACRVSLMLDNGAAHTFDFIVSDYDNIVQRSNIAWYQSGWICGFDETETKYPLYLDLYEHVAGESISLGEEVIMDDPFIYCAVNLLLPDQESASFQNLFSHLLGEEHTWGNEFFYQPIKLADADQTQSSLDRCAELEGMSVADQCGDTEVLLKTAECLDALIALHLVTVGVTIEIVPAINSCKRFLLDQLELNEAVDLMATDLGNMARQQQRVYWGMRLTSFCEKIGDLYKQTLVEEFLLAEEMGIIALAQTQEEKASLASCAVRLTDMGGNDFADLMLVDILIAQHEGVTDFTFDMFENGRDVQENLFRCASKTDLAEEAQRRWQELEPQDSPDLAVS